MINYLRVGKITKTQGIKGELKVFATTDDIKRYDCLHDVYLSKSEEADDKDFLGSNAYEIISVKYVKDAPIIKLKGVDTIEDATKYIGENIYVKREDAVTLSSSEYYISDLIGLTAYENETQLGKVIDIMKTKAQSILVIECDKKQKLVPLVYEFVEKIDLKEGKINIKTIEGLL